MGPYLQKGEWPGKGSDFKQKPGVSTRERGVDFKKRESRRRSSPLVEGATHWNGLEAGLLRKRQKGGRSTDWFSFTPDDVGTDKYQQGGSRKGKRSKFPFEVSQFRLLRL